MNKIWKNAVFNALATVLYIIAVGFFMYYGSLVKIGRTNTMLVPIALLLLLVLSAAITGFLIFGKPALMYIDGKKKEAISLLTYTLTFFSIITLIAIVLLVIFTQ
jgi:nitrogen fixation/metabolism regulation signal transduction histidine kinase